MTELTVQKPFRSVISLMTLILIISCHNVLVTLNVLMQMWIMYLKLLYFKEYASYLIQ